MSLSPSGARNSYLPTSPHQGNSSNRQSHLPLTRCASSHRVGHIRLDIPVYLWCMVQTSLAFHLEGDTRADYPTDLLAFLIVVYLAIRWNAYRGQMPGGLFRVIVRDATHYFLVIFTSHVALEMTLLFARVSILSRRSIFPL